MLEDRPRVESAMELLAARSGYRVRRSTEAFAGRKLYLEYASAEGFPDRISVDLNFLFRVSVGDPTVREMWQPGDLLRSQPRCVSLDELCAGKLLALLDRGAPRDAWDASQLPNIAGATLQARQFRARFIALSAILPHPLSSYRRTRLEELLTQRAVDAQLAPMLAGGNPARVVDLVES